MALGRIADTNLAAAATLSGGAWSAALPLANMQGDRGYVSTPARQPTPADISASRFDVTLDRPRAITLLALLFHTLSSTALYRVTLPDLVAGFDAPAVQTPWTRVYGRVFPADQLAWEDANFWTGQLLPEDVALYGRHLFVPLDRRAVTGLRVEIDDTLNSSGYFDVGGLWIADAWSPTFNFERGRTLSSDARDLVDEAPSGRVFGEERTPRRKLALSWAGLDDAEAYRLFDAAARARSTRTLIVVPDIDDPLSLVREAFPATFEQPPAPKFTYTGGNQVSATLKEVIA